MSSEQVDLPAEELTPGADEPWGAWRRSVLPLPLREVGSRGAATAGSLQWAGTDRHAPRYAGATRRRARYGAYVTCSTTLEGTEISSDVGPLTT